MIKPNILVIHGNLDGSQKDDKPYNPISSIPVDERTVSLINSYATTQFVNWQSIESIVVNLPATAPI